MLQEPRSLFVDMSSLLPPSLVTPIPNLLLGGIWYHSLPPPQPPDYLGHELHSSLSGTKNKGTVCA